MTIDVICPLYNAENYLEELHTSILKQENVDLKSISYIGGVFVGNPARQLVDKKSDNTII